MNVTAGELIAIITAAGTLIISVGSLLVSALTSRAAARKGEIASLHETLESLQHENQRLWLRLQEYEGQIATLKKQIDERDKRIEVLEASLKDATVSRADREQRVNELETELNTLLERMRTLEDGRDKR